MLPTGFYKNNRFDQYRTFCTVMQVRSISLAAQQLGLSQSAVTLRIKSLEEDLGCKFFVRSKRLIPSDSAIDLYQALLPLVNGLDSAVERFIEKKNNKKKTIKIAANSSACAYLIPKAMSQFSKIYDDIEIELYNINADDACSRLKNETIDFMLYPVNSCNDSDCNYKKSYVFDPILLVQEGHSLSEIPDEHLTLSEISRYPLINIANNPSDVATLPDIIREFDWGKKVLIENGCIDFSKKFVKSGIGVAIAPSMCLASRESGIAYKNLKNILPPIEYGVSVKKGIKHSHYISSIIKIIDDKFFL